MRHSSHPHCCGMAREPGAARSLLIRVLADAIIPALSLLLSNGILRSCNERYVAVTSLGITSFTSQTQALFRRKFVHVQNSQR